MSKTQISFSAVLNVGEEKVPLLSEIVFGNSASQDGIKNGFLFKLDRQPSDPPVTVYLGDVIDFIENKLGAATIDATTFNSKNQLLINIYEFTINSTEDEFLFSINIDVEGANPAVGVIALPDELNKWVKINSLGISFSATKKSGS
jgi:hypothetical protein